MTARDFIAPLANVEIAPDTPVASPDDTLFSLITTMVETGAEHVLIAEEGISLGCISRHALIDALAPWLSSADETSVIILECHPEDYSASLIAHAVEDVDAHLLTLLTAPSAGTMMRVCLRVRLADPASAIHSLERYGFRVVDAFGAGEGDLTALSERLEALKVFLNV